MVIDMKKTISQHIDDWLNNRRQKNVEWHPMFTILPKHIGEGKYAFFETIERRKVYYKGTALLPETGDRIPVEKSYNEYREATKYYEGEAARKFFILTLWLIPLLLVVA